MNRKDSTGGNVLGAALAGAALGAAAVFLSDKKNRDNLKKSFETLKADGEKKVKELRSKTDEAVQEGRKKVSSELENAAEKVEGRTTRRTNGTRAVRA